MPGGDGAAAARAEATQLGRLAELAGQAARDAGDRRGGALLLEASPLAHPELALPGYLEADGHLLLAGSFAGVVVGLAAARLVASADGPLGVVDLVYVEPDARRVGVGDALMESLVAWADDEGCAGLDVSVLPGDRASKALLETWGFTARALTLHRDSDGRGARERASLVPCAGAVVVENGRLLLVRRANPPEAGLWSLPGGRVEPDEEPAATAARETLEETGCHVVIGALAGRALIPAGPVSYAVDDFFAQLVDPQEEPTAGSDASEARLVPLDQVAAMDLVTGLEDWLTRHGVL
jgi:ADP-ribose pyrophosphatase YjhB (NUDIX family)/N-acetylglutamate synthase-like GNAT family acetyltransferase